MALAVVFIGLAALFVTCYIVWSRRNERQYPPRCWAVVVALVWVSLQIFTYVLFWALSQRPPSAPQQVTDTFKNYQTALVQGNGESAWAIIDSQTKDFYSECVQNALSLPGDDLERLPFTTKFMVLRLRHEFRKQELEGLSGHDVFLYGITNHWVNESAIKSVTKFQNITVDDRSAAAYLSRAPTVPA